MECSTPFIYKIEVQAIPDPQVILRVLGLLAQRSMMPRQLHCRVTRDCLHMDVEVGVETVAIANILAEKMRSVVMVDRVTLLQRAR